MSNTKSCSHEKAVISVSVIGLNKATSSIAQQLQGVKLHGKKMQYSHETAEADPALSQPCAPLAGVHKALPCAWEEALSAFWTV